MADQSSTQPAGAQPATAAPPPAAVASTAATAATPPTPGTGAAASSSSSSPIAVNPPSAASLATQQLKNQDYLLRDQQVIQNNAQNKVSLVGRFGGAGSHLFNVGGTNGLINNSAAASEVITTVVFTHQPELTESGQAMYQDISAIRSAASMLVYQGSPSRTYSLTAKFISRSIKEATANFKNLNVLRAWRMPMSTFDDPETLRLFAYGSQIKGVPVVLQSITADFSPDVDFISIDNVGTSVPIIQTISLSLREIRSWDDLETFSYTDFKNGTLNGW